MTSLEEVRAGIAGRLRSRRAEIEQAILAHVRAVPDPVGDGDTEYVAGLRETVAAVVDYGLAGIEQGEGWPGPVPSAAVAQGQRAARNGVALETVLRRYVVGHTLLGDFVMQEAERGGLLGQGAALRGVQRMQASLLDRVMIVVTDEYNREAERAESSPEQRCAERVRRLLAGGPVDTAELGYELDGWHLGVIARGTGAGRAVRGLAAGLDRRLLSVSHGEETVWAWLGGQRRLPASGIERRLSSRWPAGVSLAVGEPGSGVDGWRLTHGQAQAALRVGLHRPHATLTRYGDAMLLAAVLQDDVLARSLLEMYVSPLNDVRDGPLLCETLRAYFAAEQNARAAAAALGVDRSTVYNHLRTVEKHLGGRLSAHQAELEVALRLAELEGIPHHSRDLPTA
jgi:GGDEF-like domain/PucR C-terminal helix-turn-helix domain